MPVSYVDLSDARSECFPIRISCAKIPGAYCHLQMPVAVKPDGLMYGIVANGCEESWSKCPECDACVDWLMSRFWGLRQFPDTVYPPGTCPPG